MILSGSVLATSSISTPPFLDATIAGFYVLRSNIKAKQIYLTISTPSWTSTAFTNRPLYIDIYILNYTILRSLRSSEVIPNHLLSEVLNFHRSLTDLNSTLQTARKCSLSTATSMHLGLQDETASGVKCCSNPTSCLGVEGYFTLLNTHVELPHEVLGLVFMEIEIPNSLVLELYQST